MPPSRSSTSPIPSRCLGASSGSSGAVIAEHRRASPPCRGRGCRRSRSRRPPAAETPRPIRAAGPRGRRPGRSRRPPGAPGPLALVPVEAAVEPAVGALGRAGGVVAVGVEGRALVEDEGDVGAERRLHLHRDLGRDEQLRAVAVGAEADALLGRSRPPSRARRRAAAALDLVGDAAVGEREDLEAAGVGDQRPLPAHEPVQAAGGGDPLRPGRDEQVVGVAEDQLVAEPGDLVGLQPAHRPLRRQRDEGRRLDRPVRRCGARPPGRPRPGRRSRTSAAPGRSHLGSDR